MSSHLFDRFWRKVFQTFCTTERSHSPNCTSPMHAPCIIKHLQRQQGCADQLCLKLVESHKQYLGEPVELNCMGMCQTDWTQASTEKKGLVLKNLQPEKYVLNSRDIFKPGRVISLLVFYLNILNYDMSNCGMEDKGQQWSTLALHTPQCNAVGRCQLLSGSHKAARSVVQMTYLAFPQSILTQMLTHLRHF